MRVLVFDVGGTYTKYALVEDYDILRRDMVPTPRKNFLEALSSLVEEFEELDGIAMGFPGIVSRDGVVLFSPHLPSMVGRDIGSIRGVPVRIDNDANLFALGQYVLLRDRGIENLIGITLGTGVGGGIILEGKLYRGRGGAGEVGHIIIDVDGPRCDCGNYGCAEAFLGEAYFPQRCMTWMEREGREPGQLNGKVLRDMAAEGDPLALECWRWYGEKLAILVASMVNIFDPDAVSIGGGLSGAFDYFGPHMSVSLRRLLGSRIEGVMVAPGVRKDISSFLGGFELFRD